MAVRAEDDRLAARAQLDFTRELVARFVRYNETAQPVVVFQSQYIAIVALLRSVGHVFEKVDCADSARRAWCKGNWKTWSQEPIFGEFIEPTRNVLLKEFRGGLETQSAALGSPAFVADPSTSGGVSRHATFDASQFRDPHGKPVVTQLRAAIDFWDRHLKEAEAAFHLKTR
jgi:hypothetical protein